MRSLSTKTIATWKSIPVETKVRTGMLASALFLTYIPAFAQSTGQDPWSQAVTILQQTFTGTIARALAVVSVIVGGLMFAFGEGGSKRTIAGIVFGVGMAVGAVNFVNWLFPAGS